MVKARAKSLATVCVQVFTKKEKMVDEAKVKYVCDIYDWDGKGEIDLFFLGDICYALGLNITKKVRKDLVAIMCSSRFNYWIF